MRTHCRHVAPSNRDPMHNLRVRRPLCARAQPRLRVTPFYAPFHHERSAVTVFDEVNVAPNVGSMWSETLGHLPRVFTASANIEQRLGRAPTASEIRMGATDRS
jgi:hypothetical protein